MALLLGPVAPTALWFADIVWQYLSLESCPKSKAGFDFAKSGCHFVTCENV